MGALGSQHGQAEPCWPHLWGAGSCTTSSHTSQLLLTHGSELPQAAQHAQTAARRSSLGARAPRARTLLPIVNRLSSVLASGSAEPERESPDKTRSEVCQAGCRHRAFLASQRMNSTEETGPADSSSTYTHRPFLTFAGGKGESPNSPIFWTTTIPIPEPFQITSALKSAVQECRRVRSHGQTCQGNPICSFPFIFLRFQRKKWRSRCFLVLVWTLSCAGPVQLKHVSNPAL